MVDRRPDLSHSALPYHDESPSELDPSTSESPSLVAFTTPLHTTTHMSTDHPHGKPDAGGLGDEPTSPDAAMHVNKEGPGSTIQPTTGVPPETALLLETAAHAAHHHQPSTAAAAALVDASVLFRDSLGETDLVDMSRATEDAVALAAMQEAAAMVMQAQTPIPVPVSAVAGGSLMDGRHIANTATNTTPAHAMHAVFADHPSTDPPANPMDVHGHPQSTVTETTTPPMSTSKRKAYDDLTVTQDSSKPPSKRAAPTRIAWSDRLQQLVDYKAQHGNLLIPIRYKHNPSLGKFVHNTREQYKLFHKKTPAGYKKKCSLTPERIRQLDDVGFAWTTERTKQQTKEWQARFQQLKRFKEEYGHCLVPHGYVRDPSFAEWIHRQRTSYNSKTTGPNNPMLEDRFQQLKALGFNFTVHSDKWMDHWNQLKDYKDQNGDCQVPTHYAQNPKLGRWVHTQRHQRRLQQKGKKSCMTQARIDLLNQLDFSWEVRPSLERPRATWQQRLDELTHYNKEHGHFMVDPNRMPQLSAWCQEQRQRLKQLEKNHGKDTSKRMNPDRVKALREIGFTKEAQLIEGKGVFDTTAPSFLRLTHAGYDLPASAPALPVHSKASSFPSRQNTAHL